MNQTEDLGNEYGRVFGCKLQLIEHLGDAGVGEEMTLKRLSPGNRQQVEEPGLIHKAQPLAVTDSSLLRRRFGRDPAIVPLVHKCHALDGRCKGAGNLRHPEQSPWP